VTSPQNGSIQVLSLGGSPVTPTGRREKIHQCAQCPKRYADLKGLAAHIEKIHNNQLVHSILPTPPPVQTTEKVPLECPYCPNSYSRRDKLNEHIRKIHPEKEVPRASRSPNKVMTPPNPLALLAESLKLPLSHASAPRQVEAPISHRVGDANIEAVLKNMAIPSIQPTIQPIPTPSRVPLLLPVNGVVRGKYKPKQFACPHCGKRYCDATRLQTHVEARHLQSNDPWKDVGPGADIAVKNEHYPSGFEVFKVIGVYSTGLRLKCVRYAPIDLNKWVLTEEINKNVVKQNILKILTPNIFFKIEGSQVFTMDRATVAGLYRGLGPGQNGRNKDGESSDDERLEIDQSRESVMNGKDESNGFNEDDDKVMVEPVFEDGLSESGDIMEGAPSEPGDIDEVQVSEEATMSDDDASEDPMSESRDPLE